MASPNKRNQQMCSGKNCAILIAWVRAASEEWIHQMDSDWTYWTYLPVVYWPAHHPHAVVRQRGDREAGDQGEGVEGGDKHLAQSFVPLVVGVAAPQRDHAVHGDGDGHVEDVRARQGADEELQRLPLLLLGADAEDAPSVGQDGHARADQPSQRVGVDDVILHGKRLIHHVGVGRGEASGAARKRRREQVHTRRRRRW